jgi:flagellar basal-body rod protein FlgF
MSYGLYISAAGADVQSERIQIISNNLANVTTPGFMRELALVQARHSEAVEQGLAKPGTGSINDVGGGLRIHETLTQYAPGVTKPTGIETDAALVDTPGKEMSFFVIDRRLPAGDAAVRGAAVGAGGDQPPDRHDRDRGRRRDLTGRHFPPEFHH